MRCDGGESYEVGIVLPYDLHTDLITVTDAAELAFGWGKTARERRRQQNLIRKWVARGHLTPQDHGGPGGGPRFHGIDVLRAKKVTHDRDPRHVRVHTEGEPT